jgi:hypothetical protein
MYGHKKIHQLSSVKEISQIKPNYNMCYGPVAKINLNQLIQTMNSKKRNPNHVVDTGLDYLFIQGEKNSTTPPSDKFQLDLTGCKLSQLRQESLTDCNQ